MQKQNSQWRLLIKNKLKNYFLKIHIKKLVIKKNNKKKRMMSDVVALISLA
jgi:hypothetical protein